MHASLYNQIVYKQESKTKEKERKKKDRQCDKHIQISIKGRQSASSKQANNSVAEFGRMSHNSRSTKFHCNFPPFSTCAVFHRFPPVP